jgi:hypothetical protein
LNATECLTTAVIAGNIATAKHFFDVGGDILHRFYGLGLGLGLGFDNAIRCTAMNSREQVLEILLEKADKDMRNRGRGKIQLVEGLFQQSIDDAANAQHASTAIMLFEFALRYGLVQMGPQETNQVLPNDRAVPVRAAENGCVDLVCYIIKEGRPAVMCEGSMGYHLNLHDAVIAACHNGRVGVMRYLPEARHITVTPSFLPMQPSSIPSESKYRDYTPLELAVSFGHRTLVNLLLEFGAQLESKLLVYAVNSGNGPVSLMVRHLIEETVIECRSCETSTDYGRIFKLLRTEYLRLPASAQQPYHLRRV